MKEVVAASLNRRDANKILDLATEALQTEVGDDFANSVVGVLRQIVIIAKRMDARTGKSDPSLRRKKR